MTNEGVLLILLSITLNSRFQLKFFDTVFSHCGAQIVKVAIQPALRER
ncbi:hypothetical protein VAEU17_4510003 [Vibrio aestuarianus]|nr:hypothetical protein VAEU17_4510003 [Vibrio aestuarianus]